MARKLLLVANWKMNNAIGPAVVLAQEISNRYEKDWADKVQVVVCPPFVDIKPVKTVFEFDHRKITVGAQNVYFEPQGAYTGEISVPMLDEIGCTHVIVGHSERRQYFFETNEDVNKKVKAVLAGKMAPIVCVGESLHMRETDQSCAFVASQVQAAFAGLDEREAAQCIIAYEPLWAIGTGRNATPDVAQEMCAFIRQTLADLYSTETAEQIRILYGGSLNEGNIEAIIGQPDVDGGLVGGASLKATSFASMIKSCTK